MIGETIKIGFDGTAVGRGLRGIMGNFGKLSRGIGRVGKQAGIGFGRQMGYSLFGQITRVLTSVPRELSDLVELRQEFFALNDAVGANVDTMLALRDAISKTSNVSPDKASLVMKTMVSKVGAALKDVRSEEYKAIYNLMGARQAKIAGLSGPEEQLERIAVAYRKFRQKFGIAKANDELDALFGGRLARDVTPLLLNFESSMTKGREKTKDIAEYMTRLAPELDKLDDIMTALNYKMSEFALGMLDAANQAAGGNFIEEILKIIRGINFKDIFDKIINGIKSVYSFFDNGGLGKIVSFVSNIGGFLMDKLKSMKGMIVNFFTDLGGDIIRNLFPADSYIGKMLKIPKPLSEQERNDRDEAERIFRGSTASLYKKQSSKNIQFDNTTVEDNTGRTNTLLERILDNGTSAVYG